MNTFLNTLFGGMEIPQFLGLLVLAMLGSLVRVAYRAEKKRRITPNSPVRFSVRYFWYDNILKFTTCLGFNAFSALSIHATGGTTVAMAIGAFVAGYVGGQGSVLMSKLRTKAPQY